MNDYITDYLAHQDHVQDYLCHYGVKGMKWGVRHDKSSKSIYGRDYKTFKRDRRASKRIRRTTKRDLTVITKVKGSGPKTDAKYAREVRKSNTQLRMDKAASKYDQKSKSLQSKGTKLSTVRSKMYADKAASAKSYLKYGKGNRRTIQVGKNVVQNIKDTGAFYKNIGSGVAKGKGVKAVKDAYSMYMNTPITVLGYTGTQKVKRKNYMIGNYKKTY